MIDIERLIKSRGILILLFLITFIGLYIIGYLLGVIAIPLEGYELSEYSSFEIVQEGIAVLIFLSIPVTLLVIMIYVTYKGLEEPKRSYKKGFKEGEKDGRL